MTKVKTKETGEVTAPEVVTLGTAILQGVFEDGSPEWHEQRTKVIGGSEIASIVQAPGAFTSRYKTWYIKAGFIVEEHDQATKDRFEWGHRLEAVVAQKFQDNHPEFDVNTKAGSWVHKDRPWHGSNPDGLLTLLPLGAESTGDLPSAILEIKISGTGYGWEHDTCPIKYVAQMRWYMECFGFDYGYLAVLVGSFEYREFLVPRLPTEPVISMQTGASEWYAVGGQEMLDAGEAFFESLPGRATAVGTPPPIDGGEDTYAMLKERNPEIHDTVVELDPVDVYRANDAVERLKAAEAEARRAKGVILDAMGKAKAGMVGTRKVARRQATKGAPALYLL